MKRYIIIFILLICPFVVNAKSMTAVEYIESLVDGADKSSIEEIGNTGLAYDGTVDNNLRYIGLNPKNYVDVGDRYKTDIYKGIQSGDMYRFYSSYEDCISSQFYGDGEAYKNTGCEKVHSKGDIIYWRIIGVMNNINSNNIKESKIKLIRDEGIGLYFIDSTPNNINDGEGISEWSQSDLNKLLNEGYDKNQEEFYYDHNNNDLHESKIVNNSLYWNSQDGMCIEPNYNWYINTCDFTGIGLTDSTKKFIDSVIWDTGTYNENDYYSLTSKPIDFYGWERTGTRNKYKKQDYANDEVDRTAYWTGKIGLMYLSDLGFSTSGDSIVSRRECLNKNMLYDNTMITLNNSWFKSHECYNNTWLATDAYQESTFNFDDQYGISSGFVYRNGDGYTFTTWLANGGNIHPVFYLKNNTIISSGDGTKDNPYKLLLEENNSTKVTLSTTRKLTEIYQDIDVSSITWNIEDESILKIENNTIIPIKVGVTEITGELDGVKYKLTVEITKDLLTNPKTSPPIFVLIGIIFVFGLFIIKYKKEKKYRKKIFVIVICYLFPFFVSAKSMTAVEYIESIVSSNNADKTSIEEIGNTGLAYDGTVDNNLRYIGANPNNYVDIGDRYQKDIYIAKYYWTKNNNSLYHFDYYNSMEECENANRYQEPNYHKECSLFHNKGDIIYWRILGVFNNIEIENKTKEKRIKIVREESLGRYNWDYSYTDVNDGNGVNEWSQADLMKLMNPSYEENEDYFDIYENDIKIGTEKIKINNSLYYNSQQGKCAVHGEYENCNFTGYGLSNRAKVFVDKVYWNTGVRDITESSYCKTANALERYNDEHKNEKRLFTNNSSGNPYQFNDGVERNTKWFGSLGLVHYSDVIYASNGNSTYNREECLNNHDDFCTYNDNYENICAKNNYLISSNSTLTMDADDYWGPDSIIAYNDFNSYEQSIYWEENSYPVFHIKANTIISSGDGSKDNPYKLLLEENNSTKVTLSTTRKLTEIYQDIDVSSITWNIEDESILKIENNTIIPIKVGVTEITGELDGVKYKLTVEITKDLLTNPKTKNQFMIIFIIIIISSIYMSYILYHKKKQK